MLPLSARTGEDEHFFRLGLSPTSIGALVRSHHRGPVEFRCSAPTSLGPSFNLPFGDYTSLDGKSRFFRITKAPFALVDQATRSVADWDLARCLVELMESLFFLSVLINERLKE